MASARVSAGVETATFGGIVPYIDDAPAKTHSTELALVAEHDLIRSRASAALASGGAGRVRPHESWDAFLHSVESSAPDFAVVCWDRLGSEQVAMLASLRDALAATHVILVAASFARSALAAALNSGVAGFVRESEIDDCLALAVEAARLGQMLLPREVGKITAEPALSVREKQILGLVVMGLSNAEIATTLFVTESTVKSHLSSAFARLGVRSRNQATALILDPERGYGAGILAISPDDKRR